MNTFKITKWLTVICQYFHSDANTKLICISIMLQGKLEYIKYIIGWMITPNQYFSTLRSMPNVKPIKIIAFKMMNYSFATFVLKCQIRIQHVIHHINYSCSSSWPGFQNSCLDGLQTYSSCHHSACQRATSDPINH